MNLAANPMQPLLARLHGGTGCPVCVQISQKYCARPVIRSYCPHRNGSSFQSS